MSVQTTAVTSAAPRANQNSQAAALSAIRWAREEEFWASVTSRLIPARAVSVSYTHLTLPTNREV